MKIANPYFSYYSYLLLWSYGPLNFFEKKNLSQSFRLGQLSESAFMAQVSAACSITLLTHVEYYLSRVTRGKLRFVRKESSWQNLSQAHLQLVTAASSQPPPAESMSPKKQISGPASCLSSSTFSSFTVLPSIVSALPRHRVHLKSGSGCKGPLMPLHFLSIQYKQLPQKFAKVPTPF